MTNLFDHFDIFFQFKIVQNDGNEQWKNDLMNRRKHLSNRFTGHSKRKTQTNKIIVRHSYQINRKMINNKINRNKRCNILNAVQHCIMHHINPAFLSKNLKHGDKCLGKQQKQSAKFTAMRSCSCAAISGKQGRLQNSSINERKQRKVPWEIKWNVQIRRFHPWSSTLLPSSHHSSQYETST